MEEGAENMVDGRRVSWLSGVVYALQRCNYLNMYHFTERRGP